MEGNCNPHFVRDMRTAKEFADIQDTNATPSSRFEKPNKNIYTKTKAPAKEVGAKVVNRSKK